MMPRWLASLALLIVLAFTGHAEALTFKVTAASKRSFTVTPEGLPPQKVVVVANTPGLIMGVNPDGSINVCWNVGIVPETTTLTGPACEASVPTRDVSYFSCGIDINGVGNCGVPNTP